MEAPKMIWYSRDCIPMVVELDSKKIEDDVMYIRADLVEKLKGYAGHHGHCVFWDREEDEGPCTCGLTEVLKEVVG